MAKKDVFREAQKGGFVPADANVDDYTEAQLLTLLGRGPAFEGSLSASSPQVAADGHVNLSQEDLDARQPAPKE